MLQGSKSRGSCTLNRPCAVQDTTEGVEEIRVGEPLEKEGDRPCSAKGDAEIKDPRLRTKAATAMARGKRPWAGTP